MGLALQMLLWGWALPVSELGAIERLEHRECCDLTGDFIRSGLRAHCVEGSGEDFCN